MEMAFIHDLTDGFCVIVACKKDSMGLVVTAVFYTLMAQFRAPELGLASCDLPPVFVQLMN